MQYLFNRAKPEWTLPGLLKLRDEWSYFTFAISERSQLIEVFAVLYYFLSSLCKGGFENYRAVSQLNKVIPQDVLVPIGLLPISVLLEIFGQT